MYLVASGRIRETFSRKAEALKYAKELSETNHNQYTPECTAYVYRANNRGTSQELIAEYEDGEQIFAA